MRQLEAGFTLIELLVAMTAAGLLLAGLSWSVSRLGKQLGPPDRLAPGEEVAAFDPLLRSLVAGARPEDGQTLSFSRDSVRFLTAVPQAMGGRGEAEVRLGVAGSAGARFLEGSIAPNAQAGGARKFRMTGLWDTIRILPLEGDSDANGPAGMKIDFRSPGRAAGLVALTKVNTAADCVFDLISMACRP